MSEASVASDRLLSLAVEVLGEGATIEREDARGVLVLRATAGDKSKVTRSVSVEAGPTAEGEARSRLFSVLLRESLRLARERDARAQLVDAAERAHR